MPTKAKRAPAKSHRAPSSAQKVPKKMGGSLAAMIRAELAKPVVPGELLLGTGDVEAFKGRATKELTVSNLGDRPIQVGSHCHFFEANHALKFDREQAFGFRLCIPAGTAVRFEPGEEKQIMVVALAGKRVAHGINGLTDGSLDDPQVKAKALTRAAELGFAKKG